MLTSFFGSVFWMIVTLGLLVTFHEFGHFWVARLCGVKVTRFSVGFGKALWQRTARSGTQYQVAAIPLGGYVKMVDARDSTVPVEQRDDAFWAGEFTRKPVWKRLLIIAAGPAFNVIFALVAFWVMFLIGAQAIAPTVNPTPQGLAYQAGLRTGDRLLAVNGEGVQSYDQAMEHLADNLLGRTPATVMVQSTHGGPHEILLPLARLNPGQDMETTFTQLGLKPMPAPPIAAHVMAGEPAAAAGIEDGDVIERINGQPVPDFERFHAQLAQAATVSPTIHLDIRRAAQTLHLTVVARQMALMGQPAAWAIGIQSQGPAMITQRYGPVAAARAAGKATWDGFTQTVSMMAQLITGKTSSKNVSGVIGIAQMANTSASLGVTTFLKFLALVSLSLAIVNLLPIPVLDGGQLLFYLIEAVKGSPLHEKTWMIGQAIGIGLLVGLMSLAFFNDIHRLIAA